MDIAIAGICLVVGIALGGVMIAVFSASRMRVLRAELAAEALAKAAAAEEVRRISESRAADLESLRRLFQSEREAHVSDVARMNELKARLEEQKAMFAEAQAQLSNAFKALSDEALKSNNRAFLDLAKKTFDALISDARGDVARRQEAIDGLIRPLGETLKRYEEHLKQIEEKRNTAYGSLEAQLQALAGANEALRHEASQLVTALRTPNVQGRWGEVQLRRVVELAGMTRHCDFTEQPTQEGPDGLRRPDLVVHLAGERKIIIDAKAPVGSYLEAMNKPTEDARREAFRGHARALRSHMESLARKNYWEQFEQTPECVVMFVPGESFLASALAVEPTLLQDGYAKRVLLASPTMLMGLLLGVAQGWRQAAIEENAREISELGKILHDRVRTLAGHFQQLGRALGSATEHYNRTVASLETKVLGAARKFKELGAAAGEEVPELSGINSEPHVTSSLEADDRAI